MAKIHGLLQDNISLDKSYKLNTPSPTERGEADVMSDINGYIKKIGKPIDIKVGSMTFDNIYGINKVEGTPKADLALVSYNERSKKFEDVCFISHKMGRGAEGFQQYSGITPKADGAKRGSISEDKSVTSFLKDLTKVHNSIVKDKKRYYRVVDDNKLIGKAVYGPEYGTKNYGIDNIHFIAQGNASFTKSGKVHVLKFSSAIEFNPDVKEFKKGEYTAIIGARYTSGRNYEVNGKTYSGVRVLIMPKRLIGGKAEEI